MKIYTESEAIEASLEYFGGDELAAKVFVDKYALRNENNEILEDEPSKMHWRLAKEFARIEKKKFKNPLTKEEIFSYLDKYKYIVPQGSILAGAGDKHRYVSLSNCYVVPSTEDSYGGICQTDSFIVQISKRRGGIGYDISNLRPKGFNVKNSARTTTGACSFMERFSNTGREVGQNNRRAAQMITMSCHHPDIMDFIKVKQDKTSVTGANISVKITEEFLEALKNDENYELRWPVNNKTLPEITKDISAKKVWDALIESNQKFAEPGILNWSHLIKESPADCYEKYQTTSTNPSLRYDTLIATDKGMLPIGKIVENNIDIKVKNINKEWRNCKVFKSGINKQLVRINFTNGRSAYCTPEHQWPILQHNYQLKNKQTGNFKKVRAKNLKRYQHIPAWEDFLPIDNQSCTFSQEEGFVCGWTMGDGWKSYHKNQNTIQFGFIFNNEDVDCGIASTILNYCNAIAKRPSSLRNDHDSNAKTFCTTDKKVIKQLSLIGCNYKSLGIPNAVFEGNIKYIKGFIDGLFSSDGYVDGKQSRIVLRSCYEKIMIDVQKLLSIFGIHCRYYKQISEGKFPNNKDYNKKYIGYSLCINGIQANRFASIFSLSSNRKQQELDKISCSIKRSTKEYLTIKSVEYTDIYEDVYDITVYDNTHTFLTEYGYTSNCSEIPLSPFDSCRLLCLNLTSYINNPFTKKASFDFDKLYEHAKIAQRLMDDVVDLEEECIKRIIKKVKSDPESEEVKASELYLWEQILEACVNGRRTGTGITGMGDCLAMLGVKYGSPKSIKIAEKIYKALKLGCYRSSVDVASELGPFPVFNYNKEKDCDFLLRIKEEDPVLYSDMKKYGRRNIACLTIAPTGTISTQTQSTSGIEPVFMLQYTRRKKINDDKTKADFVDKLGDRWQEFTVYHHGYEKWKNTENAIKNCPYICSAEINWQNRVKLQAAVQRHCDHAISSTVNLPKGTSVEEIDKIYRTAFESGCKGLTVYVEESRDGVLVNKGKSEQTERPRELDCEVYHTSVKGDPFVVLIGILNNQPYEIFCSANGILDPKLKQGQIIKLKRPRIYKAIFEDGTELSPVNIQCTDEQDAITRSVSLLLRSNIPMNTIVTQLEKTKGSLSSFAKAIARTLKKWIPNGTLTDEECPECSNKLIRQDGCKSCTCGYAAC